jgi:hypothetical protein
MHVLIIRAGLPLSVCCWRFRGEVRPVGFEPALRGTDPWEAKLPAHPIHDLRHVFSFPCSRSSLLGSLLGHSEGGRPNSSRFQTVFNRDSAPRGRRSIQHLLPRCRRPLPSGLGQGVGRHISVFVLRRGELALSLGRHAHSNAGRRWFWLQPMVLHSRQACTHASASPEWWIRHLSLSLKAHCSSCCPMCIID